jgi:hypothetical protein
MLDTLADKTSNASSTVQEGSPSSPLSSFRSVAGIEQVGRPLVFKTSELTKCRKNKSYGVAHTNSYHP